MYSSMNPYNVNPRSRSTILLATLLFPAFSLKETTILLTLSNVIPVLFVLDCGIMWYVFFSCLLPLTQHRDRFIHVVTGGCSVFIFITL